ncbi:hypothetical protein BpHYR1_012044 [Brachionus plicatilis]|uniref:Uncharacterized protein n=1 Tax=Brachionus plicatilis TaxID=10195 RepID=A0A3M7SVP8_BRAPC|nr:hypothetical protein BpHYR1_012044 [Brachionus plicatilis]
MENFLKVLIFLNRFAGTNEAPVVVYENMVEGEYRFVLKVWSSEGEFSQDFVHVFVHGSTNENVSAQAHNPAHINQNMIEIELDIEPSLLSEGLKIEFLNKLQNFLLQNKEFRLTDPKLVLINSRLSYLEKKSSVVLELLVTDLVNSSIPSGISDDLVLGDKNRHICPSAPIVLQLRKKQKSFKNLLDSIQTIIERIQINGLKNQTLMGTIEQLDNKKSQVLDFLNVKILSIRQSTCFDDRLFDQSLNHTYSCSGHGTCDMHSRKCICNKYWMPNYSRYFLNYESDLTDGNNCEYNIPLTVLVLVLIGFLVYLTLKVIFKYFFYYLCCCCLCCRRIKIDKQRSKRLLGNSGLDESYLNDSIDMEDYDNKYKK